MTPIQPPGPLKDYPKLHLSDSSGSASIVFVVHTNLSAERGLVLFDQYVALPLATNGHFGLSQLIQGGMHPRLWDWYIRHLKTSFTVRIHPHRDRGEINKRALLAIRGTLAWSDVPNFDRGVRQPIKPKQWPNGHGSWAVYHLPADPDEPLFNS
jgi:hypothetical protein